MALRGLRSLYFALAGAVEQFRYLRIPLMCFGCCACQKLTDIKAGSENYANGLPSLLRVAMVPRAYWKGYLKLSLVSCPIQLFPATSEREKNQISPDQQEDRK